MKKGFIIVLFTLIVNSVFGQNNWQYGQIKVSANGHYLCYDDGTPFFWLGDTGWELFHRLKLQEIAIYLDNRQQKGFNVIQAAILAEIDGLRKPNQYGEVPLENLDPTTPNEKYFQFVDTVVKLASSKGLYMGLLPTWGDKVTQLWGVGPVVFNPENAYIYGLWIGKRYNDFQNIIWILGGDRPPMKDSIDWRPIWRNMAKGILDGTNNRALITYHPWGGDMSTSQYIHNEAWLDLNMIQSGHGGGHDVPIWNLVQRDFDLIPTKPTLDAEPNYEDHPVNPWPTWNPENGYYRDYDVRKQAYRSVFAGACGVTYGHHSVWQFWSSREEKINYADRYWTEAINRPGAFQVGYLKMLIESRPQLNRIPDQSIIVKGQGEKGEHICAFRDSAGSYEMIYIPVGKTITINTSFINSERLNAWWFNPRTAESIRIGSIANQSIMDFTTPTLGFENDWVLIIDNAKNNFRIPDLKR
jgi:hypothetical protein